MSTDEPFRTKHTHLKGMDYLFVSLDQYLTSDECEQLAVKYFDVHKRTTLPGEALTVDLRPAFRKPLSDVTPKFSRGPASWSDKEKGQT
jgi:hypothetical protein